MATVPVKAQATFCAGGNHAHVTLTVNNVAQGSWNFDWGEVQQALTDHDKRIFTLRFLQLRLLADTPAALKTELTNGFTVQI